MANPQQQQQDEDLVLSFFPDPPPFYRHFTTENQERLKELEKEAASNDDDTLTATTTRPLGSSLSAEQILDLPTELRYLIPPEPPADDEEFTVFNQITKAKGTDVFMMTMETISSAMKEEQIFEDWTYEQLYPSSTPANISTSTSTSATLDRQDYLFRFLRSIMLSYISLLGIAASNPTSPHKNEKLKDILTMVTNMHALLNEYRPHQARQTLIKKMEEQVERKKSEIEGVRKMAEKVKTVLEGFGREVEGLHKSDTSEITEKVAVLSDEERTRESQMRMWEAMDELLG